MTGLGALATGVQLHEAIHRHGRFLGEKPAINDGTVSVTYHELSVATDMIAAGIQASGVSVGDRVAIMMEPSALHIAVLLGVMRSGAIACPVITKLAVPEQRAYLQRIEPSFAVADVQYQDAASELRHIVVPQDSNGHTLLRAVTELFPGVSADAKAHGARTTAGGAAMAFPTGGTTGLPKAAVWSHEGLALSCMSCCIHVDVRPDDIELYMSPFFHVTLITGLFSALLVGATVELMRSFSVAEAMEQLETGRITRFILVPTALSRIIDAIETSASGRLPPRCMPRTIVFGASSSSPMFADRLRRAFHKSTIYTGYGATEFGPVTRTLGDELSAGRQVGVGRPVAGIDISIIGPDGHTLPDGEIGEVAVRCPWRMLGYIGSTDEPVLATDRGAILLGDLGRIEDGYLFIEGRTRELIKSGGEQIFPVEVENQLLLHPDVIEAAAYGVPDETWGERLECMVVLRLGSEVTSAELRDFCRTSLAGFKVPKVFVFGDSVPKTVNQKVDRAALRRQATGAHA